MNVNKTKVFCYGKGIQSETNVKYPCSKCGRGVGRNLILCEGCSKWVQKNFPTLEALCRGKVLLLLLSWKSSEVVEKFCCLGDVISKGVGVCQAVTVRIRAS